MMKKVRMIPVFLALAVFLTACSNQEDQQAVSNVENLISAIETENLEEETIDSARAAYEALDDDLKGKVTNYQNLLDAETEFEAQLLQEREKHGEELLKDAYNTLCLNIAGCAALREGTASVWKSAIDDKYADFNDALSALFQGSGYTYLGKVIVSDEYASNFKTALDTVKGDHETLAGDMRELASLEIDEAIYETLTNLYAEYVVLYNQVISPSGSYISYCTETNESASKVKQAEAMLDLVWPY